MIAAGKLRHRLSIAPITRGRDALNGVSETVGAASTVWGDFAPVGDGERFAEGRFAIRPTHRAIIRAPLAAAQHRGRISFRDAVYDIVEIRDPSERQDGRMLELLCVKRVPGQSPAPPS